MEGVSVPPTFELGDDAEPAAADDEAELFSVAGCVAGGVVPEEAAGFLAAKRSKKPISPAKRSDALPPACFQNEQRSARIDYRFGALPVARKTAGEMFSRTFSVAKNFGTYIRVSTGRLSEISANVVARSFFKAAAMRPSPAL